MKTPRNLFNWPKSDQSSKLISNGRKKNGKTRIKKIFRYTRNHCQSNKHSSGMETRLTN